jgi:hypothetical protein
MTARFARKLPEGGISAEETALEDRRAERNLNPPALLEYWREEADKCGAELARLKKESLDTIEAQARWDHVRTKLIKTEKKCEATKAIAPEPASETPKPKSIHDGEDATASALSATRHQAPVPSLKESTLMVTATQSAYA